MIVPNSAVPWITQHRSAALGDSKAAYSRLIREDYQEMEKWLPAQANSILDIGCGLAGIDTHLYERYGSPLLHLLDGTGKVPDLKQRIGYRPRGMKPFNDMLAARELLAANGVDMSHVRDWPVGYDKVIKCDLCISLLSWGWHYPIDAYLKMAWWSIGIGGRLIIDIRMNTGGETALDTQGFTRLGVIKTTPKGWRLCYERTAPKDDWQFNSDFFS